MKKSNLKYIFIAVASVAVVSAIVVSSVMLTGKSSVATPDETVNNTATEIVTQYVEVTDADGSVVYETKAQQETEKPSSAPVKGGEDADKNKEEKEEPASKPVSGNSSGNNSSNNNSSDNNSSFAGDADDYVEPGTTTSEILTVDGEDYNIGEIITCELKVKSPDVLINYQADINYDSNCLQVEKAQLVSPAKAGGMLNSRNQGKISFNGSNINDGYDLRNGDTIVRVKFRVVGKGNYTPTVNWSVATQFTDDGSMGTAYVKGGELKNGFESSMEFSRQD